MEAQISDIIRYIELRDPQALGKAASAVELIVLSQQRRDFVRLQDAFAYNLAGRLVLQLKPCLDSENCPHEATLAYLRLVRGVCLLHRPSRSVFGTEEALLTLVNDGLAHPNSDIQEQVLYTLVAVLVRQVQAIRRIENLKVLKRICAQFKSRHTAKHVKLAILQFLFFYLIPETQFPQLERDVPRKTTAEKQHELSRYLSNVDGLVRELEVNQPFGSSDIEW